MTAEEFRALGIAFSRGAEGWQTALAKELDVSPRTIRRWAKEGPPEKADELIRSTFNLAPTLSLPRDEWLIADGIGSDREYIVHLQPPRFSARIASVEYDGEFSPEEEPVDISGVIYSTDTYILCEFVWFDRPPSGEGLNELLRASGAAIARDASDEKYL